MSAALLPQLYRPFLTDAGLETDFVFNRGIDLPHFASITLLGTEQGRNALDGYFRDFLNLAERMGSGLILESATWRASPEWAKPLGMSEGELHDLNRAAVDMLVRLREEYRARVPDIVVSGCIGPRGDGYDPGRIMAVDETEAYHSHQAQVLVLAGADMLSAITMTNVPEAIGVAQAARELGAPVAISFTVETDGRLPTGDALADAVSSVDEITGGYPAYFMINCAHPTHFSASLEEGAEWMCSTSVASVSMRRCSLSWASTKAPRLASTSTSSATWT